MTTSTYPVNVNAHLALRTDRYAPFTMQEVPDYRAHLQINYRAVA